MTDNTAHAHCMLDTYTHTQVVLIAFPLRQLLHERASVLPYTYITCLVIFRCGHIFTEGVFVTQLSSDVGKLSLTNYVGYDKLLFH